MADKVVDGGGGDWRRRVRGGGGSDANAYRERNTGNINYNTHAITWPNNTTYSDTHTNTNSNTDPDFANCRAPYTQTRYRGRYFC
jgi:hypothetical protein